MTKLLLDILIYTDDFLCDRGYVTMQYAPSAEKTVLRVKCAEIVLIIPIITIYHFTIKGRYSLSSLCLALSPKMFVYTLLTQVAYWISAIV